MRDEDPAEFWCRRPEGASSFLRPAELGMLEPRGLGLPNPCDVKVMAEGLRRKDRGLIDQHVECVAWPNGDSGLDGKILIQEAGSSRLPSRRWCSALKTSYRHKLYSESSDLLLVYLRPGDKTRKSA
jgi:hypothetical protein